jgi:hypothetical protein
MKEMLINRYRRHLEKTKKKQVNKGIATKKGKLKNGQEKKIKE